MQFELDITLMAVTAALFVRFAVLAATLPLLEIRSVPPLWRFALAFCFAGALAPAVRAAVPAGIVDLRWQLLVVEAARSLVVGAMLGLTINLVFTAVRFAGEVAGMQIGFSIVNAFDPATGAQVSVISQLYYILTVMIFFATGAHHVLLAAMYQSCVAVPPFAPVDGAAGAWYLLQEYGSIFTTGVRIAAPVIVVLLLVSASMGVIVKTVPQLNVLVVGFPIKIAVGLMTFGLSLVFFKTVAIGLIAGLGDQLDRVLLALS
ncbi:flagellar biosynthetic protein FliR [bacterium]|nr:flagellar biosynthetic protein FliR [bacterium]